MGRIILTSSHLGLGFDEEGKAYNYRSNRKISVESKDILEVVDCYDNKDDIHDVHNHCQLIMDISKYGDCHKIDVAESFEKINQLLKENEVS